MRESFLFPVFSEPQQNSIFSSFPLSAANQKISKYKLLQLFNQYCRKDRIEIEKNTSFECDKSIINTRQKKYEIPTYEEMICDMGKWMKEHKDIYKNYEV